MNISRTMYNVVKNSTLCKFRIFQSTQKAFYTSYKIIDDAFLDQYRHKKPNFGFNGLGEVVYRRTYSRVKEDGSQEQWFETVARVVNGTYNMQKRWIEEHQLGWNQEKAVKSAQEMYRRIFEMKFLPPGRGLWAMGTPLTEQKGLYAALNNCAFVSTENIRVDGSKPFTFLMDASMLGVGVGFDTKGAGKLIIKGPNTKLPVETFVIPDSREGWVESVKRLLDSYFRGRAPQSFNYDKIRPPGLPIKGFGGVSSGSGALKVLHEEIRRILDSEIGKPISVTAIVDIMNLIGKCVQAASAIKRSAEIAFGDPSSEEFINLKNYDLNPHRAAYGWASNNSVFAEIGMEYDKIAELIAKNGEPGFAWLQNMRAYSRMNGVPDYKDRRASGGNPCLEQTLESYELCCLVETFPMKHESLEDFLKTLKYAYLYAKTVTLGKTQWPETNRVLLRNRRIGCSLSGIAQFISARGIDELKKWCTSGYKFIQDCDKVFSDWLAIPRSIKTTSIKPSGTVSLVAGATPGMHYPESRFYIRRMRISAKSDLLQPLIDAGYRVEKSIDSDDTMVVEFPIDIGKGIRTAKELSMWEQLSLAAFLQKYWADNQVSCTITFDPETEGKALPMALDYFQYQLKGVSFLPRVKDASVYPQMPYEEIDEQTYNERVALLKPIDFSKAQSEEPTPDKFCDGEQCYLEKPK